MDFPFSLVLQTGTSWVKKYGQSSPGVHPVFGNDSDIKFHSRTFSRFLFRSVVSLYTMDDQLSIVKMCGISFLQAQE